MKGIIVAGIKGVLRKVATETVIDLLQWLAKLLKERPESTMNKDADKIIQLAGRNR
ncbi:hypothetical protein [Photobacterium indicum]|uniref:hypothetical protein n=1 Tax=Photobacterium indicum TaxID=81447 RepID=UPI001474F7B3|nr:hypothetical protein [Photobacterium indicum]